MRVVRSTLDPALTTRRGLVKRGNERPSVRVRVVDQECEARVVTDPDGVMALLIRPDLISTRAYVALGLALSPLVEHGHKYLSDTA